jgi:hypothetical protein
MARSSHKLAPSHRRAVAQAPIPGKKKAPA